MSSYLQKTLSLSQRIAMNQVYYWKPQSFHSHHRLFDNTSFSEKPPWLKKLKLKQAAMQKNDGRPVYLKKGTPDKILYNLTLVGLIAGLIWSFKIVVDFDVPEKE